MPKISINIEVSISDGPYKDFENKLFNKLLGVISEFNEPLNGDQNKPQEPTKYVCTFDKCECIKPSFNCVNAKAVYENIPQRTFVESIIKTQA